MQVSAYGSPDILSVTFRDPYMFVGVNNLSIRERGHSAANLRQLSSFTDGEKVVTLRRELPLQM